MPDRFQVERIVAESEGQFVMPLDEETVRNLQRLGRRLPDEDAAVVLLSRRELSRMHPSDRANKQKADVWFAKSVGVWDPQAGEVTV